MHILRKLYNVLTVPMIMIKYFFAWFINYSYDAIRFLKHSSTNKFEGNKPALLAHIMASTHSIEKRLTFKDSTMGHGYQTAVRLLEMLESYEKNDYKKDEKIYLNALSVLEQFVNNQKGDDVDNIYQRLLVLKNNMDVQLLGGAKVYTKEELSNSSSKLFKEFMLSRYSVRNFLQEKVGKDIILEAVDIARKSPSACNRQPARIYVVEKEETKRNILSMLNGIRGFEDNIPNLCAVTSDMSKFYNIQEHNQSFIDGGIFLMSVLLAFHSLGIAACTLNWCVKWQTDREIRRLIPLKESENIIAFIAFGYMPAMCYVAKSLRYEVNELVTFV